MNTYSITLHIQQGDMTCANCSSTVKHALMNFLKEKEHDYQVVTVSFMHNVAEILELEAQDKASVEALIPFFKKAIDDAGFTCISHAMTDIEEDFIPHQEVTAPTQHDSLWPTLIALTSGGGLMLAEHMSWLPESDSDQDLGINLAIGAVSVAMTGWIGQDHFRNAWRTHGAMDTLITLGAASAVLYSFLSISSPYFRNETSSTFFSVPLVILGFLRLSHALRNKIQTSIEGQIDCLDTSRKQLPRVARLFNPGEKTLEKKFDELRVNQVAIGSIICINSNDTVPIDGTLLSDTKTDSVRVREDFFGKKGETQKNVGSIIYAGAVNTSTQPFYLKTICEAKDNHITQAYYRVKADAPNSDVIENVSQYFLRGVISIAVTSAVCWGIWGPKPQPSHAIQVFLSVVLSACPCGFGLIDIGSSVTKAIAFEEGILIQDDRALSIDKATAVCLDKCGTLTTGKYAFKQIVSIDKNSDSHMTYLQYAIALEEQIPEDDRTAVAQAILEEKRKKHLNTAHFTCSDFSDNPVNKGRGGKLKIDDNDIILGNKGLLEANNIEITSEWRDLQTHHAQHDLPIFLAVNKTIVCLLILESVEEEQQTFRPDVSRTIEWLITKGKTIHILTGDSVERTNALSRQLNIPGVILAPEQTPQSKIDYVTQLQFQGHTVIMLGDDRNDLGAVKQADFALAIDSLAPIRGDTHAVLNGSLSSLAQLMCLAKTYREGYYTSLAIAFGINSIAIISASGALYPLTHDLIDPMLTGMAMAFSSLVLMLSIAAFKQSAHYQKNQVKSLLSDKNHTKINASSIWSTWCCNKTASTDEKKLNERLLSRVDNV